jgi:hypothetical protein
MTTSVGRYTFLSWLRRGLGNRIEQADRLGAGGSGIAERATVPVDVTLNGAGISKSFALLGPGDIIGVNPLSIVRTEPRNWITDFEPNYLAFIEFYHEDFLWRYTPAHPNGEKLTPWLALLVLKTADGDEPGEFEILDRHDPLPALRVTAGAALPPLSAHWAFGHVHINEGHASQTDFEKFILSLQHAGAPNADKIISRLFSTRHLAADTAYRAFLVPAFETGRRAGLGQDPAGVDSQAPAWSGSAAVELPYYFDWYFRTGESEDFESLVKRLEPRAVNPRVGIRDLDATAPGFGVAVGADIGAIPPPGAPQAVLGLEGALRTPDTASRPPAIDPAKPFFGALAGVLNLADDRVLASGGTADPLVTPPIYGGAHASRTRVDFATAGWLTSLNRDPRLRVGAGLGTRAVQANQEDYVARAWQQVANVLGMNRRMRLGRFAMEAMTRLHEGFYARLAPGTLLSVARPVTKKVKGSPTTIHHLIGESLLSGAPVDAAMRRLVRPRGVVARRLAAADPAFAQGRLVEDINAGRVSAAPPKKLAAGLPSDQDIADRAQASVPPWLAWLARHLWLLMLLLALVALAFLVTGLWPVALAVAALAAAAYVAVRRRTGLLDVASGIADPGALPKILRQLPPQPAFALVETDPPPRPGAPGTSVATGATPVMPPGASATITTFSNAGGARRDSVEAANFRRAAQALASRMAIRPEVRPRPALDLAGVSRKLAAAMEPAHAWPRMLASEVVLGFAPNWLLAPEHLVPAMAYPDFDDPMYEKLRDLSPEYLLPNIALIPPDTITLLRTNPAFIESYMVGLNHEFGRELLWREYPTDQRGSYFRQFWSVRGLLTPAPGATETAEQLKAKYRDISPIDTWTTPSVLGAHPPPERPRTGDLVLTVRGELLKKYPNTLIYAQKAHMARNRDGALDPSMKPVIRAIESEAEMQAELRFPLFTAEVSPDIRFFGFDLTIAQAKGADKPRTETDDWGWYFIIQELPGEPRFGMDIAFDPDDDPATPITWNDLSWDRMPAGAFISPTVAPLPSFFNQLSAELKSQWGHHAADMATILFQRPVMIAVHAREMLETLHA